MARRRGTSRRFSPPRSLLRSAPAWLILLVALAIFAAREFGERAPVGPPVDIAEPEQTYLVTRVVDGDTLLLSGGDRLRLLGVDTPETVAPGRPVEPLGPEASAFTERMVEGKRVTLGYDKERKDRYGRLLVYVYVEGVLLNEELIRAGFSRAQFQYPYSGVMKARFSRAEDEARETGRGLWAASRLAPSRGAVGADAI